MQDFPSYALWLLAALAFLGYVLGSVPFGLILTSLAGEGDLRKIGSGNIGATNVLRTGNKKLAAATLLLDMGKGLIAVLIAWIMTPPVFSTRIAAATAVAAVVGHCFPVFLGFKGGKGVATGLGVTLGLSPLTALIGGIVWLITAKLTRISSAGALAGFIAIPLTALALNGFKINHDPKVLALLLISILIIARHHANIVRLLSGTEPRVERKKK